MQDLAQDTMWGRRGVSMKKAAVLLSILVAVVLLALAVIARITRRAASG